MIEFDCKYIRIRVTNSTVPLIVHGKTDTGLEWQKKHQRKQIWVEYFIFYYNTEMETTCIMSTKQLLFVQL